jgi:hypothetical protein
MEPERPIEKALRDYAEQRRRKPGASLELHPATRRLLQGEVARRYGKAPERPTRPAWLAALWPRAVWSLATVAIVTILAVVLIPSASHRSKEKTELAQLEKPASAIAAATPPAAAPAPLTLADAEPAAKDSPGRSPAQMPPSGRALDKAEFDRAAAANTLAASETARHYEAGAATASTLREETAKAKVTSGAPVGGKLAFAPSANRDSKSAGAAASAGALADASGVSAANEVAAFADGVQDRSTAGTVPITQRFIQVPGASPNQLVADKLAPANPVLTSFQIQQKGNDITIMDADGSVYLGQTDTGAINGRQGLVAGEALNQPAAEQLKKRVDGALPAGQNYSFRVSGTNRTLNVRVVFSGTMIQATNAVSSARSRLTSRASAGGAATPPELRIFGKAVVGDQPEIEINALPTGP